MSVYSSNQSFPEPPKDAGNLKQTPNDGSGEVYEGLGRTYRVNPIGGSGRARVKVKFEGVDLPQTDILNLASRSAREKFAEELAGPMRPYLKQVFEEDLRQIAGELSGASLSSAEGNSETTTPLIARFDSLVDLVQGDNGVAFYISDPRGQLIVSDEITLNGQSFRAPSGLPFAVPDFSAVESAKGKNPRETWDEIEEWINRSARPPEGYTDLLISWIFHTHRTEAALHSPIISLEGPPELGKTRMGKALAYPSRRPVVTEMPREAHLLRYANDLDATLFLDVEDASLMLGRKGVDDIVLLRFGRGAKVARVNDYKAGALRDMVYYEIFGPTIIASNTPIREPLTSRCLPIPMRHADAKGLEYPLEENALHLRAHLIAWRGETMMEELPHVDVPFSGRLADISEPLLRICQVVAPDRLDAVIETFRSIGDRRAQRYAETWEGRTLKALVALKPDVRNGLLPVRRIVEFVNKGVAREPDTLTEQQVGNVLRTFGFRTRPYGKERRKHVEYRWEHIVSHARACMGHVLDETQANDTKDTKDLP